MKIPKLTIDIADLSDQLSTAAIALDLHTEGCAVDTPTIKFLQSKSYQRVFLNNLSNNVRDHHI